MSKLANLSGKAKTYKIGDIELSLKPRTLKDLDILFAMQDKSQQVQATKKLIDATLRDAVPDATEEELNSIGVGYLTELTNAVMDVNGFGDGLREQNKPADT